MNTSPGNSVRIVSVGSPYSVEVTVSKMEAAIQGKKLHLFAHIDHSAGAKEAGLQMQEAHVLIFGHAKAGTPLMVATPLLALDLPLKVLIWEDAAKKVWVSYDTVEYLAARHDLPVESLQGISAVPLLVKSALA
jgi:uncharacterized protein (DUF302 family)